MMMLLKPASHKLLSLLGLCLLLGACGRLTPGRNITNGSGVLNSSSEPVSSNSETDLLQWLNYRPEKVNLRSISTLRPELRRDIERSKLAIGYGLERPQVLDLGVYGKIGTSTVFVASRKHIPDFDRLYWVMVRVLSEKYGCFIRRKFPYENQIGFECRDRRTIVMQRAITDEHIKFVGWQYDRKGAEVILPKGKAIARRP